MKHRIDPKVDCVFKAILGAEDNRHLLIHFLNALIGRDLPLPITSVDILPPSSEREFLDDKQTVVDIKARDNDLRLYQIEIQMASHDALQQRILYTWADLYAKQIQKGSDYDLLKPAYSIWLLNDILIDGDPHYAHRYRIRDEAGGSLIEHFGIWLFELTKFQQAEVVTEEQRWIKLFQLGQTLNDVDLPDWMQTNEMRQVMSVLQRFSEKEIDYHRYQGQLNAERDRRALAAYARNTMAKLRLERKNNQETKQALAQAEQARMKAELDKAASDQQLKDALATIERLKSGKY
jgi:predicted transposase/invertase (TIGR01784 family)